MLIPGVANTWSWVKAISALGKVRVWHPCIQSSLTRHMQTPSRKHLFWRLFEFDPEDGLGFIAPVRSDWLVQTVLDGDPVPSARCEEDLAWRYRRQFREVR